jgi:hypothetical protein
MPMKLLACLTAILLLATPVTAAEGSERAPYITQEDFLFSGDKHKEARTWARCAALYETISDLNQVWKKPALAKQFSNFGNGAKLAVGMTFVVSNFGTSPKEISQSRFNATWNYAKVAMDEMPSVERTAINSLMESAKINGNLENEIQAIIAGVAVCVKHLARQQAYIDIWRELATSGLLTLPKQ